MEISFWHEVWANNDIAFHQSKANALLVRHFNQLCLTHGSRVFLPLCGKTLDIHWLLSSGYAVAGSELSEKAVRQLFTELGLRPTISESGQLLRYQAKNIAIMVGDIFALTADVLGPLDAVYDRAALVALPQAVREQYTSHLIRITHSAVQLLLCYEYDQSLMAGPPFSISDAEVQRHYGSGYHPTLLESLTVSGGLKGKCPAREKAWLLKPR